MSEVYHQEDRYAVRSQRNTLQREMFGRKHPPDVGSQKAAHRPVRRPEDIEPIDQRQEHKPHNRHIRAPRLEPLIMIRQLVLRDRLHLARLEKPQRDNSTADPANKPTRVRQINQLVENHRAASPNVQVRQHTEQRAARYSAVGHAAFGAGFEEARGVARDGQRVERAAGEVEEGVARRPGGDDDAGVDDGVQAVNSCVADPDYEGGGASSSAPVS